MMNLATESNLLQGVTGTRARYDRLTVSPTELVKQPDSSLTAGGEERRSRFTGVDVASGEPINLTVADDSCNPPASS